MALGRDLAALALVEEALELDVAAAVVRPRLVGRVGVGHAGDARVAVRPPLQVVDERVLAVAPPPVDVRLVRPIPAARASLDARLLSRHFKSTMWAGMSVDDISLFALRCW